MSGECEKCGEHAVECGCGPHPWADFLNARYNAILWMKEEMGYNDKKIAEMLSMDERQVFLIRTSWKSLSERWMRHDPDLIKNNI